MSYFFFFNDTATTEIYTLSLHDALPISRPVLREVGPIEGTAGRRGWHRSRGTMTRGRGEENGRGLLHTQDRKSTRLNSSHANISYAVFCLKKKKKKYQS